MERSTKTHGLKWRKRKAGNVPYWFAPLDAVRKGFEPRSVRLYGDQDAIASHCERLQAQAFAFLAAAKYVTSAFDLTFGALLDRYLLDPESSYRALRPSSEHPYRVYAKALKERIGTIRIDLTDGRDVQRWFKQWAGVDNLKDPGAHIPRARTMLAVLKAATSFGIICRLPSCAEFSAILHELEFPTKKRRQFAPTAAQVEAARKAAHAAGAPSRALAYAIQYETTLRQWDVIGVWVPLSDPRPSAVIDGNVKWIGPTWAMVDQAQVLRLTYGKTEDTSALTGAYDLSICPMVQAELAYARRPRIGPLIVNERTGLPYRHERFQDGWKADFAAAGLDPRMWNRDLRAGAITEAGIAGASPDDRRKVAGHTTVRMVSQVYDRDSVEAHRRVMAARTKGRNKE